LNLLSTILHIFKTNKQPVEDEPHEIRFKRTYNDLGIFQYEENGFTVQLDNKKAQVNWSELERLVAYKADMMTIDEIRMEISYRNKSIIITEDTPGWYQFVLMTKNRFASIPQDWDINIIQPPFETNLTLLYEREDRVMPQKTNFYAAFSGTSKKAIISAFEQQEWTCRKKNWLSEFVLFNSWSELNLHGDENDPLLNGLVAYHPDNIAILDRIFDVAGGLFMYEFYDEHDNILAEWKPPL
jgi:AAA+ ATPase superfamily predicted ATPase